VGWVLVFVGVWMGVGWGYLGQSFLKRGSGGASQRETETQKALQRDERPEEKIPP